MLPGRERYFVTVSVADCVTPPDFAEIEALVEDFCTFVEIVNVADTWPAATVTLAGTVATVVFEDVNVTTVPPEGAAVLSTTVPVLLVPPFTDVGFNVNEIGAAEGVTCSVALRETPEYTPVTVAVETDVDVEVDTGNVAES